MILASLAEGDAPAPLGGTWLDPVDGARTATFVLIRGGRICPEAGFGDGSSVGMRAPTATGRFAFRIVPFPAETFSLFYVTQRLQKFQYYRLCIIYAIPAFAVPFSLEYLYPAQEAALLR